MKWDELSNDERELILRQNNLPANWANFTWDELEEEEKTAILNTLTGAL